MDWALEAARWVCGELPAERLPDLAVQAIQEGTDTDTLVRLAGLHRPARHQAGPLFEAALRDLNVAVPELSAAVLSLARATAERVANGAEPPDRGSGRLAALARELESAPRELWVFVGLHSELDDFGDATRIGYYGEKHCAEVRSHVERQIIEAARALARGAG